MKTGKSLKRDPIFSHNNYPRHHGASLYCRLKHRLQAIKDGPRRAESVLQVIENYSGKRGGVKLVGENKREVLSQYTRRAKNMLELGTFLGFSAISSALEMGPDSKVTTVELDPINCCLATDVIRCAGLEDR